MGIRFDMTKTREQIILKNWLMQVSGGLPTNRLTKVRTQRR
jgi:hypothetical protein